MGEAAPSSTDGQHQGPATTSQINPLLRERMLNRAATFSEGARPTQHPLNRRRSSLLSDTSDTRHSLRSSTDSLLRSSNNDMGRLSSSDEVSVWHSAPLAFAILPAVGGLLFQNGSAHVTDILLLGFASMFLNWCVRSPWDWYFSAQQIRYIDWDGDEDEDEGLPSDMILEEDEESEYTHDEERPTSSDSAAPAETEKTTKPQRTKVQQDAYRELAHNEILALIACFVGPLIGAYLLHAIRSQLTRPAEGLVSNYNLTIFVMAAELRPVTHMIKLSQARMIRLQRIVRGDSQSRMSNPESQEISNRLAELETRFAQPGPDNDIDVLKISSIVRQSLQPQLDALNRAVRRYEKRQAAQTIQIEARFGDLDARLKDTLALAAAAARTGQRPGVLSMLFTWVVGLVTFGVEVAWAIATYPIRTLHALFLDVKFLFTKVDRQPQKRSKGQSNGYSFGSTTRVQSKNGR